MPAIPTRHRTIPALLGLGLASAFMLTPMAAAAERAAALEYFAEAQEYLASGDFRAAVIQLRNAVREDPDDAAMRLALGRAYGAVGDPVSAEKELRAAAERGAAEVEVAGPLAEALFRQGKLDDLFREVPRGDRPAAAEAEVAVWHGYALAASGRPEEAERSFADAVRLAPDALPGLLGLAQLYIEGRRLDDALRQLEQARAAARTPAERAQVLALQGEARRLAGDGDAAMALFDQALLADPASRTALLGRAAVFLARSDAEQAERDARTALDLQPRHTIATHLLAAAQATRGDLSGAARTLLAHGEPAYPPSIFLLASVQAELGQIEQAQASLTRYRQVAGPDPRSQRLLAGIHLRQGRADRAIAVLEEALAQDPEDGRLPALMAAAYLQKGDGARAAEWLDKAAALAESDPETLTGIAVGQLQAGQVDAALRDLERAAGLDPSSLSARLLLVLAHLKGGNPAEALRLAERLVEMQPDSPVPYNMVGGVQLAADDRAAARASFEAALERQSDFVPALLNLARLDVAEGRPQEAAARYLQVLEVSPGHLGATMALARLAQAGGDDEQAMRWLEKAEAEHPEAAAPRLRRAEIALARKEPEKALTAAREAVRLAPGDADALDALGRAQWLAGERASAVTTFRQAAALSPRDPRRQMRVVQALLQTGRIDEALHMAEEWRDANPRSAAGHLLVGEVLMRMGRPADAVFAFAAAVERQPTPSTVVRHAEALFMAGQQDDALRRLEDWVGRHPDEVAPRLSLAGFYLQMRRLEDAERAHEAVLALDGDNAVALNNLAWIYGERGDPRALPLAEKAHRLAPDSPAIADTYGLLLVKSGRTDEGLAVLRKAHAGAGGAPEIAYHLALALRQAGRTAEARAVLSEALARRPAFDEAEAARALLAELGG